VHPQGVQTIPVILDLCFHILNVFVTEKLDQVTKLVASIQEDLRSKFNWDFDSLADKFVFQHDLNTKTAILKTIRCCGNCFMTIQNNAANLISKLFSSVLSKHSLLTRSALLYYVKLNHN